MMLFVLLMPDLMKKFKRPTASTRSSSDQIITTEQRNLDTLSLKQEISQVINTLRVKQESIMFRDKNTSHL